MASTNDIQQKAWEAPSSRVPEITRWPCRHPKVLVVFGDAFETALRTLHLSRISLSPSNIHRPGTSEDKAVRSCPWMPWHRPGPRSGLTVPLPRVVMVFYSGNKPIWNACCKRHHRHSPSPSGPVEPAAGLFDDLHRSDNGTPNIRVLPFAWLEHFPFSCQGQRAGESRAAVLEKGRWTMEWNCSALCPSIQPFSNKPNLAPVGAHGLASMHGVPRQ